MEAPQSNDLPDTIEIPLSVIFKYWDAWLLWVATGRRSDFDHAMTRFPTVMWNVIFLLDSLLSKLQAQKIEQEKKALTDG